MKASTVTFWGRYGHHAGTVGALVPGLCLTAAIAALSVALSRMTTIAAFSPLMLAAIIGMLVRNTLPLHPTFKPGITFSLKRLLRLAIIMLGANLTVGQFIDIGWIGISIVVASLVTTLFVATWLGRLLGVDPTLTHLIGVGTSICGASAIVATNTVVHGKNEDVGYALATITLFGTVSMFLYPGLIEILGLTPTAYGIWTGASIHEIAQVAGASFQGGAEAGDIGMIAKLGRVALLAPVILALAVLVARQRGAEGTGGAKIPLPWFLAGFIALIVVNSMGLLPADLRTGMQTVTPFVFAMALAAMGLEAKFADIAAKGWRPLLLGAGATLYISLFSLIAILWFY